MVDHVEGNNIKQVSKTGLVYQFAVKQVQVGSLATSTRVEEASDIIKEAFSV